jgi:thiamine-phosphate pyrophosphorylase
VSAPLPDARLRLLLITPPELEATELLARTRDALAGGVRAIQLRNRNLSAKALLALAERLREVTRNCDALLIINGRADIARAAGADGVHTGGREIPPAPLREWMEDGALFGYSAHAGDATAVANGVHYLTYSPVYRSPGKGAPTGLPALADAARRFPIPVLALGGIGSAEVAAVAHHGAAGIAVIGSIYNAADVAAAAADLVSRCKESWHGAQTRH